MSSTTNKNRTNARRSGINALKQLANAQVMEEHLSVSELSRVARVHPTLRQATKSALNRQRKEWLIRWYDPVSGLEDGIDSSWYFVTVASTWDMALQHFILADSANDAVVESLVRFIEFDDNPDDEPNEAYAAFESFREQLLKKYSVDEEDADIATWYNEISKTLRPGFNKLYQAFLRTNVNIFVKRLNFILQRGDTYFRIDEMRRETYVHWT